MKKIICTVLSLMLLLACMPSAFAADVITDEVNLGSWKLSYVYTDAADKDKMNGQRVAVNDKAYQSNSNPNGTDGEYGFYMKYTNGSIKTNTYISLKTSVDSSFLKPDTKYQLKLKRYSNMAFETDVLVTGGVAEEIKKRVSIAWTQKWADGEYTYDFTTDASNEDVTFEIRFLKGGNEFGGSRLYIDEVSIYELDADGQSIGENLVINGGFEDEPITTPLADNVTAAAAQARVGSAYLTWTNPTDEDFKQVRIYSVTETGRELMAAVKPDKSETIIKNLEGGKQYTFLIVSLDKYFNESSGVAASCTLMVAPEAPAVTADDTNNVIIGIDSTMEYKIDLGEWQDYTGSMPDLSGDHLVYVRVKETEVVPTGKSKVLVFLTNNTGEESANVTLTSVLLNSELTIEGKVPGAKEANVLISMANAEMCMFVKQVKTDKNGNFAYTAVMNDYIDENGYAYTVTDEDESVYSEHTDMSGSYIIKANSDRGELSDEKTVLYGNRIRRKKVITELKAAEEDNDVSTLFDSQSEYYTALSTLGFDVVRYNSDAAYKSSVNGFIVSGGMDAVVDESDANDVIEVLNLVHALDTAQSAAVLQNLILDNEAQIALDYKGESMSDIIEEGDEERIAWFYDRILDDSFSSLEQLRENFEKYGALYEINTATYMTIKEVLKDNIGYFSPETDTAYARYEQYSSQTAVNQAIISYIKNNGKLISGSDVSDCLENAVKAKPQTNTSSNNNSYSGGNGGGSGSSGGNGGFAVTGTAPQMPVTSPEISAPTDMFTDISQAEWAREAIVSLYEKNIISGFGDNTMRPNENVTREQFVKMLVAAFEISTDTETVRFDDMNENEWYVPYVSAAYNAGIVKGIDEKNFGIGRLLTREDMAVMIYRTMERYGMSLDGDNVKTFADEENISDYAKDAVLKLAKVSIVNGVDNNNFDPKGNTTRAQSAMVIYNVLEKGV